MFGFTGLLCIVDNTCYKLGGDKNFEEAKMTTYAPLSSLLDCAESGYSTPQTLKEWDTLEAKHPLIYSSIVELDGKLTAFGGSYEERLRCGTKFISTYDPVRATWVECKGAELPVPLYRPGVVKLEDNKVMVIGGQPKMQQFSQEVYIGSFIANPP